MEEGELGDLGGVDGVLRGKGKEKWLPPEVINLPQVAWCA